MRKTKEKENRRKKGTNGQTQREIWDMKMTQEHCMTRKMKRATPEHGLA